MKNSAYVFVALILTAFPGFSQVGINTDTPNVRAVLDLNSPTNDQGLLVPRLSSAQRTAVAFTSRLSASENGLLIFDTDDRLFYYWMYPQWVAVDAGASGTSWRSGTEPPQSTLGEEGDFYLNVVDGNVYKKNGGSYLLAMNIRGGVGPQGPEGPAGPQGLQGEKGDQGDRGIQGEIGPMGPQGPEGPAGPQGLQGEKGDQGDRGIQGEIGPMGPQGPEGPAGPQGLQGEKGEQGEPGIQGEIGPMGPQGPEGPQGLQGEKGDQGIQGEIGPMGPQGPEGPAGPQGPPGEKGDPGIQGPEGPHGPPGVSTAFNAVTVTSDYTATAADDVIVVTQGGTTITLPPAGLVPGKMYHIRHRLLLGSVTIRAPSGNSIIDGNAAQTFTIGLLAPTAVSIIAVDNASWYIIGKF